MSLESPPRRLLTRHRLFVLLGAVMIAMPLVQVLRHQGSELAERLAMRASLDPLAASVQVQRAVLQHDEATRRVLAVKAADDSTRRVWQAEVDARSIELDHVLLRGGWERAGAEAQAMRDDWARLLDRIEKRSLSVGESQFSHRLLIEQLLTVGDLATLHAAASVLGPELRLAHAGLRPRSGASLVDTELALARLQAEQQSLASQLGSIERARGLVATALVVLALVTVSVLITMRRMAPKAAFADAGADRSGSATADGTRAASMPGANAVHEEAEALLTRLRVAQADRPDPSGSAAVPASRDITKDR